MTIRLVLVLRSLHISVKVVMLAVYREIVQCLSKGAWRVPHSIFDHFEEYSGEKSSLGDAKTYTLKFCIDVTVTSSCLLEFLRQLPIMSAQCH